MDAPAFCRDCLTWFGRMPATHGGRRCPSCGRPRLLSHPELTHLSVAHMDCDAFYAAVEKRDDPELADKAVIVGGGKRGVVTTCCYIARIAGVRSAMPMFKALKLCPEAVIVKPRMDHYVTVGRQVRAMMQELTPLVEPLSLDEAFLDLSGTERLLGAPPALSLARLASRIEREVGITISIGLSHNKYLAKTASDLDKPRGFSVIGRAETLDFLGPRPVRSIWGVGPALAERLERDGLRTNADLRRHDVGEMMKRYGSMGQRLANLSRGIDSRRVNPARETKSISSETTFNKDIGDRDLLLGHLWRLAVRTSDRAKAKGLAGGTVNLKLKTAKFRPISRQAALGSPTNLATTIYAAAEPMAERLLDQGPFRLIGVGLSQIAPASDAEGSLFEDRLGALERVEGATDAIRRRFGEDAIVQGRGLIAQKAIK